MQPDNESTIDLTILSTDDEDDEDFETWTQIAGPLDEDMSDSDASSIDEPIQYQILRAIRKAELTTTKPLLFAGSSCSPVPEFCFDYGSLGKDQPCKCEQRAGCCL